MKGGRFPRFKMPDIGRSKKFKLSTSSLGEQQVAKSRRIENILTRSPSGISPAAQKLSRQFGLEISSPHSGKVINPNLFKSRKAREEERKHLEMVLPNIIQGEGGVVIPKAQFLEQWNKNRNAQALDLQSTYRHSTA